ncbi:MAG: DUF2834 domain-containing protein [Pseudomonadota bacterium]
MQRFYLWACFFGLVLPYVALIGHIDANGLRVPAFVGGVLASKLSIMAWLDVAIAAVVLIVFARHEGRRLDIPSVWAPVLATCLVGVSLGLPLFLWLRERTLAQRAG